MSTLTLEENDLFMVQFTWSNLNHKSANGQSQFMNKLFANMINTNPKLHSLFGSESVVREQSALFKEMVSFTMAYLDDSDKLHECMSQFVAENPSIINLGINYIEPLGISLIQTFHQTLGKGRFSPQLEGLWVKIYLYLANALLQCSSDQSDSRSLISVESDGEEHHDISGYSDKSASSSNVNFGPVKVKFQLSGNDKYKGFRRSANEAPNIELEAAVPAIAIPMSAKKLRSLKITSPVLQTPLTPVSSASPPPQSFTSDGAFDPRKLRRNSKQPNMDDYDDLPAKNPRRPTSTCSSLHDAPPRNMSFDKHLPSPPFDGVDAGVTDVSEEVSDFSASPVTTTMARDPRRLQYKLTKPTHLPVSDDEEEVVQPPQAPFDPRRLRRRAPAPSTYTNDECEADESEFVAPLFSKQASTQAHRFISATAPKVLTSNFQENLDDNSDDESSLMNELLEIANQIPSTATKTTFQAQNHYGKGLAPIREADFDDDTSSKYDSENDTVSDNTSTSYGARSSSHDEVSSGVSTLSLHNSDYRSSISSGNSSPNFAPHQSGKNVMQHTHQSRQSSQTSSISFMKPLDIPEPRTTYVKNQTKYRVSAGFMKSSFVLQNMAQNSVVSKHQSAQLETPVAPQKVRKDTIEEVTGTTTPVDSDSDDDDCLDLLNSFMPVTSSRKSAAPSLAEPKPAFAAVQPRSHPQLRRTSRSSPQMQPQQTSRTSMTASSRTFSLTQRSTKSGLDCDKSEKKSLREKLGLSRTGSRSSSRLDSLRSSKKTASTSDLCSVMSNDSADSTFSGFSFFNSSASHAHNANRRASMDSRRRSIDSKAPKVPSASKYNKVKTARYSIFGSTVQV
ncbi:hypothetical protein ABC855_g105 [[Candida] zeylanoides]